MTFNQKAEFHDYAAGGSTGLIAGMEFNNDGTKIFINYAQRADSSSTHFINEYNLTIPYDVSTKVYAGDSERCVLTGTDGGTEYDLEISSDGMRLFVVSRGLSSTDLDGDKVYGFDLTSPYDISTCLLALGTGHTDNIIITIGYLPNKKTNYAFKINGSENIGSEYKISKNINDFEIDFQLNNQDVLKPNTIEEAMVSLSRIF